MTSSRVWGGGASRVNAEGKTDADAVCLDPLSPQTRDEVIPQLTRSARLLQNLQSLLNQKLTNPFLDELDEVLKALGMYVKRMDKKKERNLMFAMRKGLLGQLAAEQRPRAVFQYVVLVLFSKAHNAVLHAPNRAITDILECLQDDIPEAVFALLQEYQVLLGKFSYAKKQQKGSIGGRVYEDDEDEEDESSMTVEYVRAVLMEKMGPLKSLIEHGHERAVKHGNERAGTTKTPPQMEEEGASGPPREAASPPSPTTKKAKRKGRSRRAD